MTAEERKRKADLARARADYRKRMEAAERAAAGVSVRPLRNPQRGPKMGGFAEDFPDERITERLPSQGAGNG